MSDPTRDPSSPPSPASTPSVLNTVAIGVAIVLLLAGGPWLIGQMRSLPGHSALQARSNQRVVTLEVGGMTCEACVGKVGCELGGVPGVSDVDIQLDQRRAYVVCDKAVADSALVGAVGRAGPGYMAAVVQK